MTWVKICGTTNLEDALTAIDAGADAVGFVFSQKSPRNISVEAAREIVEKLPEEVEKIGVFIWSEKLEAMDVLRQARLTGTQSYISEYDNAHGGGTKGTDVSCLPERARFLTSLPMQFIGEKAENIQNLASDFAQWRKNLPEGLSIPEGLLDTFVLDSGDLGRPGGTGKTFDWEKVVPIAQGMRQGGVRLVVAGGLTPENVAEAMRILQPWGVDVASGVEATPGKKDPEKVRAFVKAVREADRKTG